MSTFSHPTVPVGSRLVQKAGRHDLCGLTSRHGKTRCHVAWLIRNLEADSCWAPVRASSPMSPPWTPEVEFDLGWIVLPRALLPAISSLYPTQLGQQIATPTTRSYAMPADPDHPVVGIVALGCRSLLELKLLSG